MAKPDSIKDLFESSGEVKLEDLTHTIKILEALQEGPISSVTNFLKELLESAKEKKTEGIQSMPIDLPAFKVCMALLVIVQETLPKGNGFGHNCGQAAEVLAIILKGAVHADDIKELFDIPTNPKDIQ